jgi:hypothetical protein
MAFDKGGQRHTAEGRVSLYLNNRSNKAIEIDFGFSVNDGNGKQVAYERTKTPHNFEPVGAVNSGSGWRNFAERSTLISLLVDGTL